MNGNDLTNGHRPQPSALDGQSKGGEVIALDTYASELRSLYEVRRRIEDELSSALAARRTAVEEAETIVSQAQTLARALEAQVQDKFNAAEDEARAAAARIVDEGRREAEAILAEARRAGERAEAEATAAHHEIEKAKRVAEQEVDRARQSAKEIVESAKIEGHEIRVKAAAEAASNNSALLDDLERVATTLRRSMQGALGALDQVLDGVSDSRDAAPEKPAQEAPLVALAKEVGSNPIRTSRWRR